MKRLLSLLIVMIMIFSVSVVYADYNDFLKSDYNWAYESVQRLSKDGVINGYEDGTFRPNANITKAEFAKIITMAFKLSDGKGVFSDISSHWAKEYIEKSSGVIYAPNDVYNPDEAITRAETAYALANVLNLKKTDQPIDFVDADTVKDELKDNVLAAYKSGIIEGYENGEIRGNNPITRAECAVLITRALDYKPMQSEISKPNNNTDADDKKSDDKDLLAELEPIYRLNPGEDVLIVLSMMSSTDYDSGNDVYKIKYTIAGKDGEYESYIPYDTEVRGLKSNISEISNGDVILIDTIIHGKIRFLYVLSSFEKSEPSSISSAISIPSGSYWGYYGSGKDNEVLFGKVTSYEKKNKSYLVTVDDGIKSHSISVKNSLDADVFSPRRSTWEKDSVSAIDIGQYVFIRFTDGSASELIMGNY